MPNYVLNVLFFSAPDFYWEWRFRQSILNSHGEVDFSILIPIPKELNILSETMIYLGDCEIAEGLSTQKPINPWAVNMMRDLKKLTGYKHAGEFRSERWGAGRNAIETQDDYSSLLTEEDPRYEDAILTAERVASEGLPLSVEFSSELSKGLVRVGDLDIPTSFPLRSVVSFKTAWAKPTLWFRELAKAFPQISVEVHFADENKGFNCGVIQYVNRGEKYLAHPKFPQPNFLVVRDFAIRIWDNFS